MRRVHRLERIRVVGCKRQATVERNCNAGGLSWMQRKPKAELCDIIRGSQSTEQLKFRVVHVHNVDLPGQMQLIDNRALGHKRAAFRDWPEEARKRLLIRLWLRDRGGRAYNG
jgi:hypothetical protein